MKLELLVINRQFSKANKHHTRTRRKTTVVSHIDVDLASNIAGIQKFAKCEQGSPSHPEPGRRVTRFAELLSATRPLKEKLTLLSAILGLPPTAPRHSQTKTQPRKIINTAWSSYATQFQLRTFSLSPFILNLLHDMHRWPELKTSATLNVPSSSSTSQHCSKCL